MDKLIARIRVLLTTAITWLVALAALLAIVGPQIVAELGADSDVARWITTAVTTLAIAIAIVRRVTAVLPEARGVLAPSEQIAYTAREEALELEVARITAMYERERGFTP